MIKYRKINYFLLFCLFIPLLTLTLSWAQTKTYLIGSNDVLHVTVYAGGEVQFEADLTVSASGTINPPFIGNMIAKGLTTDQLQKKIYDPLAKDYFINPMVIVRVKEYHAIQHYISGAVNKPGMYESTSNISLIELIAKAEGVKSERGNWAYILRGEAKKNKNDPTAQDEPIKVDLQKLLDRGDISENLSLKPGDVVYIPPKASYNLAESKVYVDGEVIKPGVYEYHPGMTATNAVLLAGGFSRYAAPNRAQIIRQKNDKIEIVKINLNDVKNGKIPDIEIKPGDRINIPETWF